jgi:DNA ligase-1
MTEEPTWLSFAEVCESLAGTRSKLAKRAAIAAYLRPLDAASAGLAAQYFTGTVFPETEERTVNVGSRLIVRVMETITGATPEMFHATYRKHGDLGTTAEELLRSAPRPSSPLVLQDIAARMDALAGARAQAAKSKLLEDALRNATPVEAKYLIKLLLGDMRTGVQQSLVEEAIAAAADEPVADVRRAGMLLGNLAAVVELAWDHRLQAASFRMFHSLGFMLATPAAGVEEAFARLDEARTKEDAAASAQIEDKYDGVRAQIHCGDPSQPGRVRIFSRTRDDITASFPEIAAWFASVPEPAILDGEILAWDFAAGRALPFTALQPRLGRKRVTAAMQTGSPVLYMGFDMLLRNTELLLDAPLHVRRRHLEAWAEAARQVPRSTPQPETGGGLQNSLFATETVTDPAENHSRLKVSPATPMISPEQLDEVFSAARARGNEGLMVKSVSSAYQAGRRGSAWLKIKRELATLDVVVTAVEYGHGRRARVLSDYTFAVRSGSDLLNVGKAYSGLTDEEIATLTPWFQEHALEDNGGHLLVEPKIILEVAFNNVMQSERHNSGYALRFPRIVRIRSDKPLEEIDTLERVAEIFGSQHQSNGEGPEIAPD